LVRIITILYVLFSVLSLFLGWRNEMISWDWLANNRDYRSLKIWPLLSNCSVNAFPR
jgi:hypothetical protein